jgi:hypothetical protein
MAIATPVADPAIADPDRQVVVGSSTIITASWTGDDPGATNTNARLTANTSIGVFTDVTLIQPGDDDDGETFGIGTAELTIFADEDLVDEQTFLQANFRCDIAGTTTFTLTHPDPPGGPGDEATSQTLTCVEPPVEPPPPPPPGPVIVIASPNVVGCEGGTSAISAALLDDMGDVVPGTVFGFATDVGLLNQTSIATADLSLVQGMGNATVTASTVFNGETVSGQVVVQVFCEVRDVVAAVTADPNVIPCGGTATLTASLQDEFGNIITDAVWHWETDVGYLNVGPPNSAEFWDNVATLQIIPGMAADNDALDGYDSATVRAYTNPSADGEIIEGFVTVQQFCLGVHTDHTTAPGLITLTASKTNLGCGEAIFVGARVRDGKNQVVPDDTVVSLIASDGGFKTQDTTQITVEGGGEAAQVGTQPVFEGAPPTGNANRSITTVAQFNGGTTNGSLNATYVAPPFPGDVVITAAAGDRYSNLTLHVACTLPPGVAPVAAAGMTVPSAGETACTPIGDGVCIRPPNTGQVQIRPPSTGDAGLK